MKNLDGLLPSLEDLYKNVHAHPELSMQERRTAGLAADHLRSAGYEVTTGVGETSRRSAPQWRRANRDVTSRYGCAAG
jgi:metal-dependent amidase/aminoacylase/carboxypeptidase family protein